jgi:hypothetical protein
MSYTGRGRNVRTMGRNVSRNFPEATAPFSVTEFDKDISPRCEYASEYYIVR